MSNKIHNAGTYAQRREARLQAERDAAVEKAEVLEAEVAHFTEERDAAVARAEIVEVDRIAQMQRANDADARAEAAEGREAVLREALAPCAKAWGQVKFGEPHSFRDALLWAFTVADLRRAAEALANPSPRAEELLAAEARLEQVWAYQAQLAAKPLGSRVAAGIAAQLQRILADEEGERPQPENIGTPNGQEPIEEGNVESKSDTGRDCGDGGGG